MMQIEVARKKPLWRWICRLVLSGINAIVISLFSYGVLGPEWIMGGFWGAIGALVFGPLMGIVFGIAIILLISLGQANSAILSGISIGAVLGTTTGFVIRKMIPHKTSIQMICYGLGFASLSGILVLGVFGLQFDLKQGFLAAHGAFVGEFFSIIIFSMIVNCLSMLAKTRRYFNKMGGIIAGFCLGYCFIAILFAGLHLAEYRYSFSRGQIAYISSVASENKSQNQGKNENSGHELGFGDFVYFSVITLSSTGYGDILPVSWRARGLSSLEIILGMSWIVIVFAGVAQYLGIAPHKTTAQSADTEAVSPRVHPNTM